MSPFLHPVSKRKRELEDDEAPASKRVSLGPSYSNRSASNSARLDSDGEVWMVQWRNPQQKKHKTWDGDGVLVINSPTESTLYDSDGKIMGSGKVTPPLFEGKNIFYGGKELEFDCSVARAQFLSGACFGNGSASSSTFQSFQNNPPIKKFNPPSFNLSHGQSSSHPSIANNIKDLNTDRIIQNNTDTSTQLLSEITNQSSYWTANWRKPQGKKNKTWDGDAYISLVDRKLVMLSEEGKIMGSTPWKGQAFQTGFNIMIGGREVVLDVAVSSSDLPAVDGQDPMDSDLAPIVESTSIVSEPKAFQNFVPPGSFYATKPKAKGPLHDPDLPDALVMKAPGKDHIKRFNKRNLPIVPVVIDPILARKMRPHQQEGVRFLYECVMGMRKFEGQGCILADEMGLGKTLQTIALVWTLLKQHPYAGPLPAIQKVLIVCPVSLVNNWKAEFHKWLGRDRVGIITCDKSNVGIDTFGRSKVHQVLIIGYERLRTVIDKVAKLHPPIGLIICDEGHRLKSANNKTAAAFKALDTRKRIILSGTPIQNDLGEFHAMAEFCNPGLLDDYTVFRKVYESPILRSRAPGATEKDVEIGDARTAQLLSIAKSFVLRRDATLLKNHLPPKTEYVVFVTPTALQLTMFSKILHPARLDDLIQSSTADSLALINILTKISNSPILLKATADNAKGKKDETSNRDSIQKIAVSDALRQLPERANIADMTLSGKLILVSKVLKTLRRNTEEKCVLVSHYTSTLNILEAYCKKMSYSYYRLDGQTPQNKRQEYVNDFNKGNQRSGFIFLLSSKAGGVGINLIGASRLFLIDSDWNPSHDLQSMARCHRDGQKRPVYIYRLLTAGTIDEKIYQRQVTKLALSDSLIGSSTGSSKSDSFTRKDLRDIFRVHPDTGCNTHDLLDCGCDKDNDIVNPNVLPTAEKKNLVHSTSTGFVAASEVTNENLDEMDNMFLQKKREGLAALGEWKHLNCLKPSVLEYIEDNILRKTCLPVVPTKNDDKVDNSQPNTLLSLVNLDVIQAMDTSSIHDVPGGTISFLFEKNSRTSLSNIPDK